jgi:hypothetical protein
MLKFSGESPEVTARVLDSNAATLEITFDEGYISAN